MGEYTSAGVLIQETVWLNDLPIATLRPNGTGIAVYFVHPDELGTPRVVTDTTNKPVWRWDSDAFGRTLPNQDPLKTGKSFVYHLRYPGQYYDTQSGLHYNYFRDYDPQTGRYIQSDPIGLAGGFNTYAYVGGNPLRWVDPFGLDWVYSQSTGQISHIDSSGNSTNIGTGYAGYGSGMNNPAMQNVRGQHPDPSGPLPQGGYTIGAQQMNTTNSAIRLPASMRLIPDPNNQMFGRGGFLIHGDNRNGNNSASEGCPILDRSIRNKIGNSGDNILRVVP